MFKKTIDNIKRKRGLKAGRRNTSVEKAIKDYEKFGPGYIEGAIDAGKTLHVEKSDGRRYRVVSEGSRSCYEVPRPDILESIDENNKGERYETYDRLAGKRFYL